MDILELVFNTFINAIIPLSNENMMPILNRTIFFVNLSIFIFRLLDIIVFVISIISIIQQRNEY